MKKLLFKENFVEIRDPKIIQFDSDFDRKLYNFFYDECKDRHPYEPILDSDKFYDKTYSLDIKKEFENDQLILNGNVSAKATNPDRLHIQFIIRDFLCRYPEMFGLIHNNVTVASTSIKNAEYLLGVEVNGSNFILAKSVIDYISLRCWNRLKDKSESQSGISTLGTISETLLKKVFNNLVDDNNFFKVNLSEIQSYGDFVLMCLPNNLWISVKSNFARERLLASGYTNDILGVGFFQDPTEFTSGVRIRNFQRAGFLAMYCPDVAVTQEQINTNISTFGEIEKHYKQANLLMPININGKPFIRPLSSLYQDLSAILQETDIRKRTTVKF